jgi:hypothetical protein
VPLSENTTVSNKHQLITSREKLKSTRISEIGAIQGRATLLPSRVSR